MHSGFIGALNHLAAAIACRTALCILLVAINGCMRSSTTFPVTGTIVLANGQPLTGGTILFQPFGDSSLPARGYIQSDGSFQLGTFATDDGAIPGVHKVVITPAVPTEALDDPAAIARHRAVVPAQYQNLQSTPLEFTVNDDGSTNHFDIRLEPRARSAR